MAAILNLRNNPAYKESSLLGHQEPERGKFFPIPLDFTRNSTATYINKNGILTEAAVNVPRVDSKGRVIVETQRTNILTNSNNFSDSDWVKSGDTTVTPNAAISPSGFLDAWLLSRTSSGNIEQQQPVTSGTTYCFSGYAKKSTGNIVRLISTSAFPATVVDFDLENKTATPSTGTPLSFDIIDEGNGWYRCYFTQTASSTSNGVSRIATDDNSNVLIYEAQLEEGTYPTSTIPTQASAVTRSADTSLTTSIGSYIPSEVGTVRWEGLYNGNTGLQNLWQVDDGSALNKYEMKVNTATGRITFIGFNNGAPSWILNTPEGVMSTDTMHVVDATFSSANGAEIFVDGISRGTFTANPVANGVMSNLRFSSETGADTFKGRLSSLTMFDEILTPAQTASLI
jgi:hypothetical protein